MSAYDPDIFHVDDDMGEYHGWGSARAELLPLLKGIALLLTANAPKASGEGWSWTDWGHITGPLLTLIAEIEAPSSPATQATFTPLTDDKPVNF
jgi:hypothetical protein